MYSLRFLGGASIERSGEPITGPATHRHNLALLALLAASGDRGLSREKLAAYLWPDSGPDQSRNSLKNAVHVIRRSLSDEILVSSASELRLSTDAVQCDVVEFERARARDDHEGAVELYRGVFLDGFHLPGADELDRWIASRQDHFESEFKASLEKLAIDAVHSGETDTAIACWRRFLELDPYNSRAVVGLMDGLAASGDRAGALRLAEDHIDLLEREFGADPDPTVTEAATRLRLKPRRWVPPKIAAGGRAGADERIPRRHSGSRRWGAGTILLALTALTILLGAYIALRGRVGLAPSKAATERAPTLAVLPFTVLGGDLEILREGMVDLLSTGLDGAGGLRTISPGTVFARWREEVPAQQRPELETALAIARGTGARYALVGSAIEVGADVRFVADVYEVSTGERLGRGTVEGSPDEVLVLVDRLSVEVLRVILQRGEEELPEIELASLTTTSPAALRAFLEGEVHFRHFDLTKAREAYLQAIDADPDFALAHYRLVYVYGWSGGNRNLVLRDRHRLRAVQLADRLPSREAVLVRALHAQAFRTLDGIEPLRDAVEAYPDDAQAWFQLGETYLHVTSTLATAEEIDQAFERAVGLDPKNAHYLAHYLQLGWWFEPDSARVARRLEAYERVVPDHPWTHGGRVALDLAFGNESAKEQAVTALKTLDLETLGAVAGFLYHPRFAHRLAPVRELRERGDEVWRSRAVGVLFRDSVLWRGRLREGLVYLQDPALPLDVRARVTYWTVATGLPVSEEMLRETFPPDGVDSLSQASTVFYAGAFAADRGRWSDYERSITELERRARHAFADTDTVAGLRLAGRGKALRGYGSWRRGDAAAALSMLEDPQAKRAWIVRWWLGRLYQELGRYRDAERVYRSFGYLEDLSIIELNALSIEPLVHYELGKVYEELEEYERARESYAYFIEHWSDADPGLYAMVDTAREAQARLSE